VDQWQWVGLNRSLEFCH